MTKVYAILILICSIISFGASAQSVVRGHVIDGDTGEPMFSASVVVPETGQGVTTDLMGFFDSKLQDCQSFFKSLSSDME